MTSFTRIRQVSLLLAFPTKLKFILSASNEGNSILEGSKVFPTFLATQEHANKMLQLQASSLTFWTPTHLAQSTQLFTKIKELSDTTVTGYNISIFLINNISNFGRGEWQVLTAKSQGMCCPYEWQNTLHSVVACGCAAVAPASSVRSHQQESDT